MSTTDVKVNNKQTKETLRNALGAMMPVLADNFPELASKIDKALVSKSTTKATLEALLYDATKAGKTVAKVPVENQAKPKKADPDIEEEEIVEKSEKKTLKKPNVGSIKRSKPEKVIEKNEVPQTGGSLPVLRFFPESITVGSEENAKHLKRREDILTIDELMKEYNAGKDFYFACSWTPAQIKRYNYNESIGLPDSIRIDKFDNNLDILELVYACASYPKIWAVSVYSEGMFSFKGEDFDYLEDVNPYDPSDVFRTRVSNGMEFEIYEVISE